MKVKVLFNNGEIFKFDDVILAEPKGAFIVLKHAYSNGATSTEYISAFAVESVNVELSGGD